LYLNTHSNFSLGYGTISIAQLIQCAQHYGIKALALTDVNNTSGIWPFINECQKHNIKPLVGIEFKNEQQETEFVGIARNLKGLEELNRYLTSRLITNNDEKCTQQPTVPPQNLMTNVSKIYPFLPKKEYQLKPNEYIGVTTHQINQLYQSQALKQWSNKLVILQPLTFFNKANYHLHLLLRAINDNQLITKLDKKRCAPPTEIWQNPTEIKAAFEAYPFIIENTEAMMEECKVDYKFHQNHNKQTYTGSYQGDSELLERLALDGFNYRYKMDDRDAMLRLLKELRIINELNFANYYLINWDMVQYAERKGYFYVGRGSGANSMVAYCMKITDVDPMELDLYFERFLNKHRKSPPDFDIDFSHKDRDDIYAYLFEKYGDEHVCLLGSYVTFQQKAAIREVGKVFGLPKSEIDQVMGHIQRGYLPDDVTKKVYQFSQKLIGKPKHLGIHACGVLISEKPIYNYTALHLPPKDLKTAQFDMYVAEDIGLHKFDVLSQRGLSHIRDCVDLAEANHNIKIDIHDVKKFKEDSQVRERIKAAKTIGCFYIESPAMRVLLTKLSCSDYITLVAASSIIRPGVAKSGMMRAYIERFHKPDSFEYLHPVMEKLLKETYGIMVYQEDVIKVAHHFAGLTLEESDVLRRGMSGKFRSAAEMEKIQEKFVQNCEAKGYAKELYMEVWRQIASFSGYSFSKAHSASYAVESYQSLYLKTYYPLEFITAVLNNFGGFYRSEFYFHEARRLGAKIEAPCVNHSNFYNRLISPKIYVGFVHIKALEHKITTQILEERERGGVYSSFENFLDRIKISFEQLNLLIRLKAFRFTGKAKAALLWRAVIRNKKISDTKYAPAQTLFKAERKTFQLPDFTEHFIEDAYDQIELLNMPLYNPFELIDEAHKKDCTNSLSFPQQLGKRITILGYLVAIKNTNTSKGERMHFGCFTDEASNFFDTVHFPPSAKQFPFKGSGLYKIIGKVMEEFGVYSVEVSFMKKVPYLSMEGYEFKGVERKSFGVGAG